MARGGIADRDAPNCQNSTKYWASVVTEETTTDDSTMSVEVAGNIRASDAMGALLVPGNHVGTQVSVADPLALVRQQMAASTAAPSTPAGSEPASSAGNGNMRFLDFLVPVILIISSCCEAVKPSFHQAFFR